MDRYPWTVKEPLLRVGLLDRRMQIAYLVIKNNCCIGGNIEHVGGKNCKGFCHPKPQALREGVLSSQAGMGHRRTGPHN